jgi:nucleotide-binding universal stress UspA family protein
MAIRKLLLPVTGTTAGEAALATALRIARLWDAHLLVLHVRVDSRDVAPLAGEGLSGAMIEDMMTATETEGLARAQAMRALFDTAVAAAGVPVGDPTPPVGGGVRGPSASFAAIAGREEDLVAQQARLADLTVVQHTAATDLPSSEALNAVLFDSGRPVLVAPPTPPAQIGRRVCLAWNGTAESASAVTAALPWLKRAEAVRILAADEYQRRGPPAADLAAYLALHDIIPEITTFRPVDKDVGAGLLKAAGEFGADLLAMGAYSHSRLRQLLLGGVTRHVLEHATLPVLMNR